ncbi:hypothetical protein ACERK3_13520 [Phycisphaerales bacterium AB-hyl4]|uniref:YHS domain-containing protein n=1 Tax=Natronomicrosphaera hydrolytica TaxID=3242702 RepID=A0ABV4U872_9BACT
MTDSRCLGLLPVSMNFSRCMGVVLPAGLLGLALVLTGCGEEETGPGVEAGAEWRVDAEAEAEAAAADAEADDVRVLMGDEAVAAVEAGEATAYPLDECIVAGTQLGSMGTPVSMVYGDQEVKFCCAGCDTVFLQDPASYLAKLNGDDAAEESAEDHDHDHHHDHGHDHDHG